MLPPSSHRCTIGGAEISPGDAKHTIHVTGLTADRDNPVPKEWVCQVFEPDAVSWTYKQAVLSG